MDALYYLIMMLIVFCVLIIACILVKCNLSIIKKKKRGEPITRVFGRVQKNTIIILIIIIYMCIFGYSIYAEMYSGHSFVDGLKVGAIISIANTLRLPYVLIFVGFFMLLYQDKKIKKIGAESSDKYTNE